MANNSLTIVEGAWRDDDCAGQQCRECKETIWKGGKAMTVLMSFPWCQEVEMEAEIYLCQQCAEEKP